MSRTYYYKWQKRYLTYGLQGLYEKPKAKPVMPNRTRSPVVDKILALIKIYLTYGPARIANQLGNVVCSATVYNILRRHGLNRKIERLLALEEILSKVNLSPVLLRKIDEARPLPYIKSHYTSYMLSVEVINRLSLKEKLQSFKEGLEN